MKLSRLLDTWLDPACHILDCKRSGGAIDEQRRDAQETRRQARCAGRAGLVSREVDRDRAEIATRAMQSVAACGARAAAANIVLGGHGKLGDGGTAQVGRAVPRNPHERRPRGAGVGPEVAAAEIAKPVSDDAAGGDIAA